MTDDLLQWAEVSPIGVGEVPGEELLATAQLPPGIPNPRDRKVRRRPNKGRVKRTNKNPEATLSEPPWERLEATGLPVPRDIENLPTPPGNWRVGPRANRWRKEVAQMWGTTCHLCGHAEAHTADHLIPVSEWNNQPYDPRLARPAHGVVQPDGTEGCPTCGVKCNSSRGNKALAKQIRDYRPPVEL